MQPSTKDEYGDLAKVILYKSIGRGKITESLIDNNSIHRKIYLVRLKMYVFIDWAHQNMFEYMQCKGNEVFWFRHFA